MLDKLVLPRALAIVNQGLLIGEPPHLWLCPTSTGRSADIDCSAKRKLGIYGDQPGSVEHAENGLLLGLDNWLYSAKSNRRLRIEGERLLEEPTLFRGQWGISQDDDGRILTNRNPVPVDYELLPPSVTKRNPNYKFDPGTLRISNKVWPAHPTPGVNRGY